MCNDPYLDFVLRQLCHGVFFMSEKITNRTEWRDNRGNTVEENGPLTPSEHEELQLPKPAIITILLGLPL